MSILEDKSIALDKDIICPDCNVPMELDDIDYRFPGNQNEYYVCPKCGKSMTAKIRYGRLIGKIYDKEE